MTWRQEIARARRWLTDRDRRKRIMRWPLSRIFRAVENRLIGVGQLPAAQVHRILVLRPHHRLGNIVLLTPLISELVHVFPGARIDVLIAGGAANEMVEGYPNIGRIYCMPRSIVSDFPATVQIMRSIRRKRYDLAIDPSINSRTGRLVLAYAAPRFLMGVPEPENNAWMHVMFSAPRHLSKIPVFILRHALADDACVNDTVYPALAMQLSLLERQAGLRTLQALSQPAEDGRSRKILGVFAAASDARRLTQSWWLQFLATIRARLPEYVVVEILSEDGCSRLDNRFPAHHSSSPRELASVMSNLTHFISAPTDVMHLACAAGTPTIGLFSATDASLYEPYGRHNQALNTPGKSPEEVAELAIRTLTRPVPDRPMGSRTGHGNAPTPFRREVRRAEPLLCCGYTAGCPPSGRYGTIHWPGPIPRVSQYLAVRDDRARVQ
jgi:ADP-heptose:LPS heptosyltransferase